MWNLGTPVETADGRRGGFLVLLGLASVVSLALCSGNGIAESEAPPEHDPIEISGDEDLIAPDAVGDNGVRGGTGTEDDPWRIARWSIQATPDQPAISISDVSGYLVIEELILRFEGSGGLAEETLFIRSSDHVTIRDVRASGDGALLTAISANTTVEDVHVDGGGTQSFPCLTVHRGSIRVSHLTVVGPCGATTARLTSSTIELEDVHLQGVSGGVAVHQVEGPQTVRIDGLNATPEANESVADPSESSGSRLVVSGLTIPIHEGLDAKVQQVHLEGWKDRCLSLRHIGSGGWDLELEDLRLRRCENVGVVANIPPSSVAQIRELYIADTGTAVALGNGNMSIHEGALVNNGEALKSSGRLFAERIDLIGNGLDARATRDGEIHLLEPYRDGAGEIEGDVTITDPAGEPHGADSLALRSERGTPWAASAPATIAGLLGTAILLARHASGSRSPPSAQGREVEETRQDR